MRRIVIVFYDIVFLSINMESSISSLFANLGHQRFTVFCIDLSIYFVIFTLNKYQIIILKFVIPYFCHLISLYIYVMDFSHFHVSFIFKIIITSFSFPFPLQTHPYTPPCSFPNSWPLFHWLLLQCMYINYMFLIYKLLNLNAYMYVLRVDHLVLDSQLVYSSLGKTIFLLMSIDSIITILQQSHPRIFIDYFVT